MQISKYIENLHTIFKRENIHKPLFICVKRRNEFLGTNIITDITEYDLEI